MSQPICTSFWTTAIWESPRRASVRSVGCCSFQPTSNRGGGAAYLPVARALMQWCTSSFVYWCVLAPLLEEQSRHTQNAPAANPVQSRVPGIVLRVVLQSHRYTHNEVSCCLLQGGAVRACAGSPRSRPSTVRAELPLRAGGDCKPRCMRGESRASHQMLQSPGRPSFL